MESLGFVINVEKSQPTVSQCIEFLVFIVNSYSMSFELPMAKVKEIKSKCKQALWEKKLTALLVLQTFLGNKKEFTSQILLIRWQCTTYNSYYQSNGWNSF